jgi:hypothetical protein
VDAASRLFLFVFYLDAFVTAFFLRGDFWRPVGVTSSAEGAARGGALSVCLSVCLSLYAEEEAEFDAAMRRKKCVD